MVSDGAGGPETDSSSVTAASAGFPWRGVLFWTVFAAVIVLLRGVRWDEHYELAEVVLGNVRYPEAHPLYNWTRYVRNLQIFLSSAIVQAFPGPFVICWFRNTAWLVTLTVPLFLIAHTLSANKLAGHAAVLFAYFGIHLAFDAHYQLFAWPGYYSNGHIGRGFALFILWALMDRRYRLAAFVLAFMPAIHITQMVPVSLTVVALAFLLLHDTDERNAIVRALPYAVPGLALCAYLWLGRRGLSVPLPTEGPYYSDADNADILRGFLAGDAHRALPGTVIPIENPLIVLALFGALASAAAFRERRSNGTNREWQIVRVYALVITAIVVGTMILHLAFRDNLPAILLAWMPYRFTNHAAILLLALAPAVLLRLNGSTPGAMLIPVAAMLFETIKPVFAPIVGEDIYARYLAGGDATFFGLAGAALAVANLAAATVNGRIVQMGSVLVVIGIVSVHQFGGTCLIAGALSALLFSRFPREADTSGPGHTAIAVLGIALITIAMTQTLNRVQLPRSDFDRAVAAFLDESPNPGAMVAARPDQRTLQARIGHAVFMDEALATGIPYTPYLAAAIQKMSNDLYGIRYHPPMTAEDRSWTEIWRSRTQEEWRDAAGPYGIRYVISPNTVPLRLPKVIAGEEASLYEIPES